MNITKGFLGIAIALTMTIIAPISSQAETIDLLRSIPLEIEGYPAVKNFPETFSTADQVLSAINSTPVLLVHMEVLRRAYHQLPASQHEVLLTAIHKRRLANENDLMLGFDHGYAQLVFKENKTGLFFLRKANDALRTQFSSLAYGMAEVQADLTLEGAPSDAMTTRKLDATFQLTDAVRRDAERHQPGFWPSYLKVIEKMKPLAAYNGFTKRDFSLTYFPYGNSVSPMQGTTTVALPLQGSEPSLLNNTSSSPCSVNDSVPDENSPSDNTLINQRSALFGNESALIQFFNTSQAGLYQVRVSNTEGRQLLSFNTHTMPNIVEDLEGDGTFEIVARQYQANPLNPVLVYRHTPCGFELDQKVSEAFR